VPLSEHERRQLEQIEQALRADDPRFADAVAAAGPRVHYKRRVIAAAPGFVIGVGLLLAGVVINVIPIAVAGFVVMLACSLWAVTSYRRMTGITTGRASQRRLSRASSIVCSHPPPSAGPDALWRENSESPAALQVAGLPGPRGESPPTPFEG
jgi:Protein of unknown function (DUF3040)